MEPPCLAMRASTVMGITQAIGWIEPNGGRPRQGASPDKEVAEGFSAHFTAP